MTALSGAPELGKASKKDIVCLGGLAPHKRESGTMQGHKRSKEMDDRLCGEFLLVMAAIKTDGEIRDFYDRLKKRGKKGGYCRSHAKNTSATQRYHAKKYETIFLTN